MSITPDRVASPAPQRSPGMRKKVQKRGLSFTMMVIGCAGAGKSTFVNTLCEAPVLQPRVIPDAKGAVIEKTVEITPTTVGMYLSYV